MGAARGGKPVCGLPRERDGQAGQLRARSRYEQDGSRLDEGERSQRLGPEAVGFQTDTNSVFLGLVTTFAQRNGEGQADLTRKTLTWTQVTTPTVQTPYVASVLSEQDPGQSYAVSSKTEQDVDAWGNVTQTRLYGYSSLTTPAKIYTNTFLTGSNYTSRNIRNRLLTSTVSDGTNTVTLVDQHPSHLSMIVSTEKLRQGNLGAVSEGLEEGLEALIV
jgi:hypothetical protein